MGEIEVPVLKGITFNIEKGEMIALMGASGSGKSTLMNILGCLDRPTSGTYLLDGKSIGELSSDEKAEIRSETMGFVFQSFNLLARTNAIENVMMPLWYSNQNITDAVAKEKARSLLNQVGLGDRLYHEPSKLSGGQQQRVAIARALINNPPILFADEPTGNLDSKTSDEILEMFQTLNKRVGLTIILVTHSIEIAQSAKRIIKLKDGTVESGSFEVSK